MYLKDVFGCTDAASCEDAPTFLMAPIGQVYHVLWLVGNSLLHSLRPVRPDFSKRMAFFNVAQLTTVVEEVVRNTAHLSDPDSIEF